MLARARAIVIGTLTATIVAYLLKPFLEEKLKNAENEIQVLVVIAAVLLLASFLVALDYLFAYTYARSARVRRWLDWLAFRPFLEGFWVDVGIDCTSAADKIANYSFISIIRRGGGYQIHGRTWNVFDEFEFNWESVHVKHTENSLHFWYSGTGASGRRVDEAIARFKFSGVMFPDRYSGRYENAFRMEARRVMHHEFFKLWSKDLAEGRRKQEARTNLKRFMDEQNVDKLTFVQKNMIRRQQQDAREPYFTFVRRSNNKGAEISIVTEGLAHIGYDRPNISILDIGPGEGTLSALVLNGLRSECFKYTAVEPIGANLDAVETRLTCYERARFTFLKQTVESFLRTTSHNQFDLIIAFNSLYYVTRLDEVINHVIDVLEPHGMLLALHTDIKLVPFLDELIGKVNHSVNRDVVQLLDRAVSSGLLSQPVGPLDRTLTVEFPVLDDDGWERVRKPELPFRDRETEDVIKLISFLTNLPITELYETDWGGTASAVERHVRNNNNKLHLPIKLQILKKMKSVKNVTSDVEAGTP